MLPLSASQSPSVTRARHIERHGGGGALSDVILGGQDVGACSSLCPVGD
jgi:hypothetical protein